MSGAVFGIRSVTGSAAEREEILSGEKTSQPIGGWSLEKFANEQIRSLVQQVFSPGVTPSVRQVVFSAVDAETDIRAICRQVGETLAAEILEDVAIVDPSQISCGREMEQISGVERNGGRAYRETRNRLRGNLWMVALGANGDGMNALSLHKRLGEIRREFAYSIIAGGASGESNQSIAMAQCVDGMILVLSARYTRRLAALKVRDALDSARVRLLGTVLSDREFPIPERIYRRL